VNGPVLTLAEHHEGLLVRATLETLSVARELADRLNARLAAAVIGESVRHLSPDLARQGADRVFVFEGPLLAAYATEVWARAVAALIEETAPSAVILPGTTLGRDVAPRLAARFGLGLASESARFLVASDGRIRAERVVFGGRIVETVSWERRPILATLRAGAGCVRPGDPSRNAETEMRAVANQARARVVALRPMAAGSAAGPDLSEARVVVAAGRGLGAPENLRVIERLAKALGAAVGGSRAVVDAGWLDHQRQIGQTGRTVAPDLYIACGISGAVQHLAGMNASRTVVAINRDAEAPIFAAADFGLVGDVLEIAPRLSAALAEAAIEPPPGGASWKDGSA
jgi:electron transfer flavoprotein alpha subunit